MDLKELHHIERAMERIEEKDIDFKQNPRWLTLRQAQNLWYKAKAQEQYDYYSAKYEQTQDKRYKVLAEQCLESIGGDNNETCM